MRLISTMKQKYVLAEVDENGSPIRIFRNVKDTFSFPVESVAEFTKAFAVHSVRSKVFRRAGCTPYTAGACEWCGKVIFWEAGSYKSGEMHEVLPKGKGGEVSVANSVAICRGCHTGPNGAHGDRKWHTAKIGDNNGCV